MLDENIERIKNLMGIHKSYDEDIINEGLSDILYHYTSIDVLKNILLTDKIYASPTYIGSDTIKGLEYNLSKKKNFYVSTTRNRNQVSREFSHHNVRIKLDGKKLSQKYKGAPVDYYGYREKKNIKSNVKSDVSFSYDPEFEDRIILDKAYIENASKYILSISINYIGEYNKNKILKSKYDFIIINNICKEMNIPIAFYGGERDFRLERYPEKNFIKSLKNDVKQHIDSLEHPMKDLIKKEFEYNIDELNIITLITYKNSISIKDMFPQLTEDNISYINQKINYIENNNDFSSFKNSLKYLAGDKSYESKDILNKMLKDMTKYKTKDFNDYMHQKMWKPL